jgi:hypothetical protein
MRQSEAIAQKSLFFSIPFQQQSKPQGIGLFFRMNEVEHAPGIARDPLRHALAFTQLSTMCKVI